jgi:hypothetical protein
VPREHPLRFPHLTAFRSPNYTKLEIQRVAIGWRPRPRWQAKPGALTPRAANGDAATAKYRALNRPSWYHASRILLLSREARFYLFQFGLTIYGSSTPISESHLRTLSIWLVTCCRK